MTRLPSARRIPPACKPATSMERGLMAGEVPVHLLGAAELPLSKAPNP